MILNNEIFVFMKESSHFYDLNHYIKLRNSVLI